jgi:hypothetical protein
LLLAAVRLVCGVETGAALPDPAAEFIDGLLAGVVSIFQFQVTGEVPACPFAPPLAFATERFQGGKPAVSLTAQADHYPQAVSPIEKLIADVVRNQRLAREGAGGVDGAAGRGVVADGDAQAAVVAVLHQAVCHVLADVVPVATALHDLEEFVVGDHLAALLVEGGEDALRGQRQIDPLAAPPGRSLAQRVEGEFFADRQAGFAGVAIARGAQDLQDGVDEIGLGEGGLLQVIPGIECLHDAAVDGRRHDARDPVRYRGTPGRSPHGRWRLLPPRG